MSLAFFAFYAFQLWRSRDVPRLALKKKSAEKPSLRQRPHIQKHQNAESSKRRRSKAIRDIRDHQTETMDGPSKRAIESHVNHLIGFLDSHHRNQENTTIDLSTVMQSSISFAQTRSQRSGSKQENMAALAALGIVVGHSRFAWFAGFVPDEKTKRDIWRLGSSVRLRGRRDLAQHFCISAALAALSHETLSQLIGQMKEQADMEKGGSGFSFVDLLADQAGSRFGVNAARDDPSAEGFQRRFLKSPVTEAYMPALDGLPEGISAENLKTQYGGLNGPGFRRLQQEIRRRLDECPLFQDGP